MPFLFFGAGDRTRTGTLSPAVDFELFTTMYFGRNSKPIKGTKNPCKMPSKQG